MSVYNNDGWKWALRTFHDLSRHETRVHFQLAQDQQCELEETLSSIINNKALSMPRSKHQSYLIISRNTLKVQWKFCVTDETSVMAKTKIYETNPTKKKNHLTAIFKRTMGIYTHIDDVVSRDTHAWNLWMGTFTTARHVLTQEKHASLGCHLCLLAHDFTHLEATNDAGRWNSKQL